MPKREKTPRPRRHRRVIDSFTGRAERWLLLQVAARMPAWVTPDQLTFLGLLGAFITAAGYLLAIRQPGFLWLAFFGFVINWFGDSLDGTLARYRHIERPRYGYFLDHSTDALSELVIFLSLGLTPWMRFPIAAVGLIGYLLISLYTALSAYAAGEFRITHAYLGPTEIRLIAMLATAWSYFNGSRFVVLPWGAFTFYELILMGLSVLFYSAFLFCTIGLAVTLGKKDPAPPGGSNPGSGDDASLPLGTPAE